MILDLDGTVRLSTVPALEGIVQKDAPYFARGTSHTTVQNVYASEPHGIADDHRGLAAVRPERRRPAGRRARRQPPARAARPDHPRADGPRRDGPDLSRRRRLAVRPRADEHRGGRRWRPLGRDRRRDRGQQQPGALCGLPRRARHRRLPLAARARSGDRRRDLAGRGVRVGPPAGAGDRRRGAGLGAAARDRDLPDRPARDPPDPGPRRRRDARPERRPRGDRPRDVHRRGGHARGRVQRDDRPAPRERRDPRAARGRAHRRADHRAGRDPPPEAVLRVAGRDQPGRGRDDGP